MMSQDVLCYDKHHPVVESPTFPDKDIFNYVQKYSSLFQCVFYVFYVLCASGSLSQRNNAAVRLRFFMCMYTHTNTNSHRHTNAQTNIHTHTHAQTHTHTHTNTHTHTHTYTETHTHKVSS